MTTSFRLSLLAAGLAVASMAAQAQLKPKAAPAPAPAAAPASAAAAAAPADGIVRNPEFEKAGQNAAHAWLLLLDRKDWGSAWDASSAVFRQNVPLSAWMDNIPKLRDPFGAFAERQPLQAVYKKTLQGRPDGDYVTAFFVTKFANKPEVLEQVTTVREPDGRWRVTGYQTK